MYEAPGPTVKEVERRLKLNESVMRVLSVLFVDPELTKPQVDPETGEPVNADAADD